MLEEKPLYPKVDRRKKGKMLTFDPTVHAGHLINAVAIFTAALGIYYSMKYDIASLQQESKRQEAALIRIDEDRQKKEDELSQSIAATAMIQRQEMVKFRDDMNSWFIRINDKLDTKQDKR